ncbi:cytochrome P450 [Paraphaeosphaeria sporulosa]|uniref:Cytochrome P450 n=1 Tax=Paraphaeosphaeria sporulosa TaxID=1460663 RepID=A0A177CDP7_9PLEO|nr:cytochrome P450 [Paraphaeosphaeria sporulosa]OAG05361.1 cytochrome P450 [Paraphaeosphaeria sporulosa]
MLDALISTSSFEKGVFWLCALVPACLFANALYNLYLHPNLVLFCDPEAHAAIYGMKSNVRRSTFYVGLTKNIREKTTLNAIDPAEHAQRRKILNRCFTDQSTTAVSTFVSQHIDRWHEILLDKHNSTTEWSTSTNLVEQLDHLVFDIMGDLCFGRSFNNKEPGDNPLKEVPQNIIQYLKFYYPMCRSPFLSLIIWLKPRGLDRLVELITPPPVQKFNDFVFDSVTKRLELYKKQEHIPERERRQDMFYFLCNSQDSSTEHAAYTEDELRAEASLLIIAGSHTTTASLASIFWYLVRAPRCYEILVDELQKTFKTAEDVAYGPKLMGCTYLRACIDEGMRLVPPGPCESPREVLAGGLNVLNDHYPAGTIVGTAPWCDSLNLDVYEDPGVFRPERWVVDDVAGVTKAMVAEIRTNFHPYLTGPGSCAGKNIALAEIHLMVAKTLLRLELRKTPGSTLGEGSPEMAWGERSRKHFQIVDAYISVKQGPEVQFRKRPVPEAISDRA